MRAVCPFSTKHNRVVCLPRQQFLKSYPPVEQLKFHLSVLSPTPSFMSFLLTMEADTILCLCVPAQDAERAEGEELSPSARSEGSSSSFHIQKGDEEHLLSKKGAAA